MNEVTRDFHFIFAYTDDILIVSPSEDIYENHLKQILEILYRNKSTENVSSGGQTISLFLGHLIDKDGMHPLSEKVVTLLTNF